MNADDLLKTRTIPELRELASSLHRDGNSKRQELQHMVGSKYHDFIQSADAIATMREKSVLMENKLAGFWSCSQDLVAKTQDLLSRTKTVASPSTANNTTTTKVITSNESDKSCARRFPGNWQNA